MLYKQKNSDWKMARLWASSIEHIIDMCGGKRLFNEQAEVIFYTDSVMREESFEPTSFVKIRIWGRDGYITTANIGDYIGYNIGTSEIKKFSAEQINNHFVYTGSACLKNETVLQIDRINNNITSQTQPTISHLDCVAVSGCKVSHEIYKK